MNNGYNFIPNPNYMRNVPVMPNYMAPVPRISSLFSKNLANTSKISFTSILNGASKTLGVINQAIPVFYQVKPIWNNARTMLRVAKGLRTVDSKENSSAPAKEDNVIKKEQNAPVFFA